MNLEEEYLQIQLVSFDIPVENKERYYFLEMSTLQATTLLPSEVRIERIEIVAYDSNNDFLSVSQFAKITNVGEFNRFFLENPNFYIHNLELQLENGTQINTHDDGEVSLTINKDSHVIDLVRTILKNFIKKEELILEMRKKAGNYLAIDSQGTITAVYANFDEYVEKGRK